MDCPNCRARVPDGSLECPSCGLIFAKWKGRTAAPGPVPAPDAPPPPGDPAADLAIPDMSVPDIPIPREPLERLDVLKIILGIVLVLGTLAVGIAYLMKPAPEPEPAEPQNILPVERMIDAIATEPPPPTPTAGPTVTWIFEGKVFDILHQVPIEGVEVTIDLQPPVVATTDTSGAYHAEFNVPEGSKGVNVWLKHPGFGTNYWAGDHTQRPYGERVRMYDNTQFQDAHQGSPAGPVTLNFSMFPQTLTEEEETKIRDTLYPPAKD